MGVFGDHRHSFEADITILPLGPDTRKTPPFNGIRWDFCLVEDLDERGWASEISMVLAVLQPAARLIRTARPQLFPITIDLFLGIGEHHQRDRVISLKLRKEDAWCGRAVPRFVHPSAVARSIHAVFSEYAARAFIRSTVT